MLISETKEHVEITAFYRLLIPFLYITPSIVFIYLIIFHPLTFFQVMIGFSIYFLINTIIFAFFAILSFIKCCYHERISYKELLFQLEKSGKDPFRVLHYVIIPNYKEPIEVIEETIESISKNFLARNQIGIVLAMEERELGCQDKAKTIILKYEHLFKDILFTVHPRDLDGERPGKGSNVQWACQILEKRLKSFNTDLDNVIFTITDADTKYHSQFFEALTWNFINQNNRHQLIYQTPILSYMNLFSVPFPTRVIAIMGGMNEMSRSTNPLEIHSAFSCYSLSYKYWFKMGGFDVENVTEDTRSFLKGYIKTNGYSDICLIFLPTLNYSLDNDTYVSSVIDRLIQAKRHAWGVLEFSYFLQEVFKKGISKFIHGIGSLYYFLILSFRLIEGHWSASVCAIFTSLTGIIYQIYYLPWFKDPIQNSNNIFFDIGKYFVMVQTVIFIVHLFMIFQYCEKVPILKIPIYYFEWVVLSLPSIILYGTIPEWMNIFRLLYTSDYTYITSTKKFKK